MSAWWLIVALGGVVGLILISMAHSPKPGTRSIFFGLDVPNASQQDIASFSQKLGTTPNVTALFVKLDTQSVTQKLAAVPEPVTPFVTLEPWSSASRWNQSDQPQYSLRSLIDGRHDGPLIRIARALALANRPIYLRFAHEMNGSWYPWAAGVNHNTAHDFVLAWRHVVELMRPITGGLVKWVWSPNIVSDPPASTPSLAELYPGDDYVDYLGVTGYSHGKSVKATFGPTIAVMRRLSAKPIVLSEIGVSGSPSQKTAWLSQVGPFVSADPRIVGLVYFNTSPETTGATGDYRLDQDGRVLSAFRQVLADLGVPTKQPS